MFPEIDDVTKEMLQTSGEVQRAYMVTVAYQNAYDAYIEKHKEEQDSEDVQMYARLFALEVIRLVFGQPRT